MTLIDNDSYQSPSIEGKEADVKSVVEAFVDSVKGDTEDEQRINLSILKNRLHMAVDYVMVNLPSGVERVDGSVIQPILDEVINEKLAELPIPEIVEE